MYKTSKEGGYILIIENHISFFIKPISYSILPTYLIYTEKALAHDWTKRLVEFMLGHSKLDANEETI